MSDIKFTCPHCKGHVLFADAWAGTQVACPHCSRQLSIPKPTKCPVPVLIIGILSIVVGGIHLVIQSLGILNIREKMQVWDAINSKLPFHTVVDWGNLILQFALAIVLIHTGIKLLRMQPTARRNGIICGIAIIVAQFGYRLYLHTWVSPIVGPAVREFLGNRAERGQPNSMTVAWEYYLPATVSVWWICFVVQALALIILLLLPKVTDSFRSGVSQNADHIP